MTIQSTSPRTSCSSRREEALRCKDGHRSGELAEPSPSPPLEERVGGEEGVCLVAASVPRRSLSIWDFEVTPPKNGSIRKDGLLSPPLSSGGGEGEDSAESVGLEPRRSGVRMILASVPARPRERRVEGRGGSVSRIKRRISSSPALASAFGSKGGCPVINS